jgi:hypothetical protein
MANIAPYRLATGTVPCQTTGTSGRPASPVTQTPSTAVPLAVTISRPNLNYKIVYQLIILSETSEQILNRSNHEIPK